MYIQACSMRQLNIRDLLAVYAESIANCAQHQFSSYPMGFRQQMAEQDLLDYLREDFFPNGGTIALLYHDKHCVSALRLEPYRDGILLTGLETAPGFRCKGYAGTLLAAVLNDLERPTRVYSHVALCNAPSMAVHRACGFQVYADHAVFLDGSVSRSSVTMVFNKQNL